MVLCRVKRALTYVICWTMREATIASGGVHVTAVYSTETVNGEAGVDRMVAAKHGSHFRCQSAGQKSATPSNAFADIHLSRHAAELKAFSASQLAIATVTSRYARRVILTSIPLLAGYHDPVVARWLENWWAASRYCDRAT